jgi:hypothetical protein
MQSARPRRSALADISNRAAAEAKKRKGDYYLDARATEESAEKLRKRSEKSRNAQKAMQAKYHLRYSL